MGGNQNRGVGAIGLGGGGGERVGGGKMLGRGAGRALGGGLPQPGRAASLGRDSARLRGPGQPAWRAQLILVDLAWGVDQLGRDPVAAQPDAQRIAARGGAFRRRGFAPQG